MDWLQIGQDAVALARDWWKAATAAGVVGILNAAYTFYASRRNRVADVQQQTFAARIRVPAEERLIKLESAAHILDIEMRRKDLSAVVDKIQQIQDQHWLPALRELWGILGRTPTSQESYSADWQSIVERYEDIVADEFSKALDAATSEEDRKTAVNSIIGQAEGLCREIRDKLDNHGRDIALCKVKS